MGPERDAINKFIRLERCIKRILKLEKIIPPRWNLLSDFLVKIKPKHSPNSCRRKQGCRTKTIHHFNMKSPKKLINRRVKQPQSSVTLGSARDKLLQMEDTECSYTCVQIQNSTIRLHRRRSSETKVKEALHNLTENFGSEQRHCRIDDIPEGMEAISLLNVDVDLLEATAACLERLAPRVMPGGVVLSEDYGHLPRCMGANVVVEDFLATETGKSFRQLYLSSGQSLLIRS